MQTEIAAVTKSHFRSWSLDEREAYLKEHPNSKFHYHQLLEAKKIKVPADVPKLGTNWRAHLYHPDPDHHRRHAKAHLIAHEHLLTKASSMKPRTDKGKAEKQAVLDAAKNRLQWHKRHMKLYEHYANELLK